MKYYITYIFQDERVWAIMLFAMVDNGGHGEVRHLHGHSHTEHRHPTCQTFAVFSHQ